MEIHTHGPDLSGVVGGAGGIGGILSVSTNIGASAALKYLHADAMGNVILVAGSDGKQVAVYGYTPFGKLVNQVGNYQARFLFSSKEFDPEIGLISFGLRYLNPNHGTWINRDPLGESGGLYLYSFVYNNPNYWIDPLGMAIRIADNGQVLKDVLDALSRFIRGQIFVDKKGYLLRKKDPPDCSDCPKDENIERWIDEMLASSDEYVIY